MQQTVHTASEHQEIGPPKFASFYSLSGRLALPDKPTLSIQATSMRHKHGNLNIGRIFTFLEGEAEGYIPNEMTMFYSELLQKLSG